MQRWHTSQVEPSHSTTTTNQLGRVHPDRHLTGESIHVSPTFLVGTTLVGVQHGGAVTPRAIALKRWPCWSARPCQAILKVVKVALLSPSIWEGAVG